MSWSERSGVSSAGSNQTAAFESGRFERVLERGGAGTGPMEAFHGRAAGVGAGAKLAPIGRRTRWLFAFGAGVVVLAGCVRSTDEGRGTLVVVEYPEGRVALGDAALVGDSEVVLFYPPGSVFDGITGAGCVGPSAASASLPRADRVVRGRAVPSRFEGFEHALARQAERRCSGLSEVVSGAGATAIGASPSAAAFAAKDSLTILKSSSTRRVPTGDVRSGPPLVVSNSGLSYFANSPERNNAYLQSGDAVGPALWFAIAAEATPGSAAVTDCGTAILNVEGRRRRQDLAPDPRYHVVRLWWIAPFGYEREYPVIPCVPDRAETPFLTAKSTTFFAVWIDGPELSVGLCLDEKRPGRPVTQGSAVSALGQLEATQILHAAVLDGRLEVVIDVDGAAVRPWLPSLCPEHASVVAVGSASLASLGEASRPGRDGWAGIPSFPEAVTWATGVGGVGTAPRLQVFISGGKLFLFSEEEGVCGMDGLEDTDIEQLAGRGDGFILALGKRSAASVLWKNLDVRCLS
jgi:hypothetical protein